MFKVNNKDTRTTLVSLLLILNVFRSCFTVYNCTMLGKTIAKKCHLSDLQLLQKSCSSRGVLFQHFCHCKLLGRFLYNRNIRWCRLIYCGSIYWWCWYAHCVIDVFFLFLNSLVDIIKGITRSFIIFQALRRTM